MANFIKKTQYKLAVFGEIWEYLRVNKKWWLGPPIVILLLLGLLLVLTEGSAVAPFIYTLF
ncbi:hypothetical protein HYU89_03390 [Candidatus Collierbacteria bacterium]|nr:hypothetical protein [Candidatus Collierbacteria bacterium]